MPRICKQKWQHHVCSLFVWKVDRCSLNGINFQLIDIIVQKIRHFHCTNQQMVFYPKSSTIISNRDMYFNWKTIRSAHLCVCVLPKLRLLLPTLCAHMHTHWSSESTLDQFESITYLWWHSH